MSEHSDAVMKLLHDAHLSVSYGFDMDSASRAVNKGIKALEKMAGELEKQDFSKHQASIQCPACKKQRLMTVPVPSPTQIASAANMIAKCVDFLVRLQPWVKKESGGGGRAGSDDVLRKLTAEQVEIVMGWVESNEVQGRR